MPYAPAERGTQVAPGSAVAQSDSVLQVAVTSNAARESSFRLWWHELRTAFRGVIRSPRYSVPALLSLALSIGAATAVFSLFSAQVLRPLPFPREDELVQVGLTGVGGWGEGRVDRVSPRFFKDLEQLDTVFASLAVSRYSGGRMTGAGDAQSLALQLTSLDFFDTLGAQAMQGRTYSAQGPAPDGLDVIVLRHGFWREALGGAPIVGKTVLIDDVPKTVIGIIPDDQAIPNWGMVWMPEPLPEVRSHFAFFLNHAIGRLQPGVSLELGRERLSALSAAQQIKAETGSLITGTLTSLREIFVGAQRSTVALMLAAVLAFLLLACANVAALLGTRASVRQHEYAVRTALGASRWSLGRQSALEALILVVAGGLLGLWPALLLMEHANQEYLDFLGNTPARLDARVTLAFVLLLLVAAATAALVPVLYTRRVQPMDALRGAGKSSQSRRARRMRELLVALQVAATLALLVNAGLLVRSVRALLAVDAGVDYDGVVIGTVLTPTAPRGEGAEGWERQRVEVQAIVRRVLERLRQLPEVSHACVAGDLPFDFLRNTQMMEGEPGAQRPAAPAHPHWFSPGCFETLGTRLLSGRAFTAQDTMTPPRAIVNRAFAEQLLGVSDALGQRFRFAAPPDLRGDWQAPWIEIIGMSEDALELDLTVKAEPAAYFPMLANPLGMASETSARFAVAVKTRGDTEPLLAAVPRAIAEVTHDAPVADMGTLIDFVGHTFRERTALQRVLSAFGISAIVLAAIGLFGVTAYAVAERSAEIGIRRALGASRRAILMMILRETFVVILLGGVLGVVLCWIARRFLEAFLFGVSPGDPVTYAVVVLGIALTALLAALLPARTAAAISPSRALTGR
ncbi:MAG: FtsX-like permease family protein [Polyangiaceae bacterium]